METFFIKAAQLILAFAILVIIHEFGHFLFARVFGIRVNKFYIFFNPITSIFKWRPGKYVAFFGKKKHFRREMDEAEAEVIATEKDLAEQNKDLCSSIKEHEARIKELKRQKADKALIDSEEAKIALIKEDIERLERRAYDVRMAFEEKYYYGGADVDPSDKTDFPIADKARIKRRRRFWKDTEYGIGWLPLGGYCQISGMIDESMDTEQMKRPAKRHEFRSKPAWQRLLVMIAGVLFNFLLAILIYAGITWWWGDDHVAFKDTQGMLRYSQAAQNLGFRDGDIPLTADGKEVTNLGEHLYDMASASEIRVLRDGTDTVAIRMPKDFVVKIEETSKTDPRGIAFIDMDIPVVVHSITNASSEKAGLKVGDRIIAVNDTATTGATEFLPFLQNRPGQTVNLTVVRGEPGDTVTFPLKLDGASKIGFQLENDMRKLFPVTTVQYGLLESFPVGISKGTGKLVDYVSSMKYIFTKEGAQSVGGFGAIGSMFPEQWNWLAFWNIAAFLSVALAFMNILPIPGLDGGHVFFLLYEVIFRRKPSDKFMERAQITGMVLLLLLLLYANGMDIVRLFK